jgi:hypothetical protein
MFQNSQNYAGAIAWWRLILSAGCSALLFALFLYQTISAQVGSRGFWLALSLTVLTLLGLGYDVYVVLLKSKLARNARK